MANLLDTSIDGAPAGCRDAATSLRATLAPARDARRFLAGQQRLTDADFGDRAGTAYQAACRRLRRDIGEPRDDVRELAGALDRYADRLDDVLTVMRRVRRVGAAYGFEQSAQALRKPSAATAQQSVAWDLLAARVTDAHQADRVAKQDWRAAFEAHAGVTPGGMRGTLPVSPIPPRPWPPTDADWPPPAPAPSSPEPPPAATPPAAGPPAGPAPGTAPSVAPDGSLGAHPAPDPAPRPPHPSPGPSAAPPTPPVLLPARFRTSGGTTEQPVPESLTNHPWEGTIVLDHNDINLSVPGDWHRRADPEAGIVLAARPVSVPQSGFVPDLVVRAAPVDGDLVGWRDEAMTDLGQRLPDFALEDADEYQLGDHRVAYRRFAHSFGSIDVLVDQWAWQVDGTGITLTCSTAREDYPAYCDLFELIAGTVDVVPHAA